MFSGIYQIGNSSNHWQFAQKKQAHQGFQMEDVTLFHLHEYDPGGGGCQVSILKMGPIMHKIATKVYIKEHVT